MYRFRGGLLVGGLERREERSRRCPRLTVWAKLIWPRPIVIKQRIRDPRASTSDIWLDRLLEWLELRSTSATFLAQETGCP